jgi:glycerate 2-kinase
VAAVDPLRLLREEPAASLLASIEAHDPLFVVAAGKAAWPMARSFSERHRVRHGVVAGPRFGGGSLDGAFEWFDAGHPAPNAASVAAGRRALALAVESRASAGGAAAERGLLVVLLSGGASAMLAVPAEGVTLADKMAAARTLMNAGMSIDRLNTVRKHLSDVKGGQLAGAAARTVTLAISDVHAPVSDDPAVIGSGPTVADPTTFAEALAVVRGARGVPPRVVARLERGARGELPETIKPGDARLVETVYRVIANRETSLDGARQAAERLGYRVRMIDAPTAGESREAAHAFVTRARELVGDGGPLCVLAGGETTVTVRGDGLGGRNQELALAAVPLLAAFDRPAVLASLGTDGVDGPTDAAGAIVDSTTLARARAAGLDWESTLAANDAYHFFEPLGDLIVWGPTGTNVGDVQMLLTAD